MPVPSEGLQPAALAVRQVLAAMPDLECFNNLKHLGIMVVGASGLAFYSLGFLAFNVLTLRWIEHKQSYESLDQLESYGSLYDKYRANAFAFGLVQLLRRGTLGVLSGLSLPAQIQCFFAQLVLILQLMLHMRLQPYVNSTLNKVELGLTVASLVLAQCGMIFSVSELFEMERAEYDFLMHIITSAFCASSLFLAILALGKEILEKAYSHRLRKADFLELDDGIRRAAEPAVEHQGPSRSQRTRSGTGFMLSYDNQVVTASPDPRDYISVDELYGNFDMTHAISLSRMRCRLQTSGGQDVTAGKDFGDLLRALSPYLDWRSGLSPISHKKKARFWRVLVDAFPNLIDFLASADDLSQLDFLKGANEFYRLYVSSEGDTEDFEHPRPNIRSMQYEWVRPECRPAVACFLASASARDRKLFRDVAQRTRDTPDGSSSAMRCMRNVFAYVTGAQGHPFHHHSERDLCTDLDNEQERKQSSRNANSVFGVLAAAGLSTLPKLAEAVPADSESAESFLAVAAAAVATPPDVADGSVNDMELQSPQVVSAALSRDAIRGTIHEDLGILDDLPELLGAKPEALPSAKRLGPLTSEQNACTEEPRAWNGWL